MAGPKNFWTVTITNGIWTETKKYKKNKNWTPTKEAAASFVQSTLNSQWKVIKVEDAK